MTPRLTAEDAALLAEARAWPVSSPSQLIHLLLVVMGTQESSELAEREAARWEGDMGDLPPIMDVH